MKSNRYILFEVYAGNALLFRDYSTSVNVTLPHDASLRKIQSDAVNTACVVIFHFLGVCRSKADAERQIERLDKSIELQNGHDTDIEICWSPCSNVRRIKRVATRHQSDSHAEIEQLSE